jgi:hypothetical protein
MLLEGQRCMSAGGLFVARTVGAKCWNLLSWAR